MYRVAPHTHTQFQMLLFCDNKIVERERERCIDVYRVVATQFQILLIRSWRERERERERERDTRIPVSTHRLYRCIDV